MFIVSSNITTLKTSAAKRIARELLAEHNVLSFNLDADTLEIFEKVLWPRGGMPTGDAPADAPPALPVPGPGSDPSKANPFFLRGSALPPDQQLQGDTPVAQTISDEGADARWAAVSERLTSADLRALMRVWEGGKLTPAEETRLRAVHADFPFGQDNFNTWLRRTLRQIQMNAALRTAVQV